MGLSFKVNAAKLFWQSPFAKRIHGLIKNGFLIFSH